MVFFGEIDYVYISSISKNVCENKPTYIFNTF